MRWKVNSKPWVRFFVISLCVTFRNTLLRYSTSVLLGIISVLPVLLALNNALPLGNIFHLNVLGLHEFTTNTAFHKRSEQAHDALSQLALSTATEVH